jgi:NAD+ synthase
MDLALWSYNHRVAPEALASALGLSAQQAAHVYADIEAKRRAAAYLHAAAETIEPVVSVRAA